MFWETEAELLTGIVVTDQTTAGRAAHKLLGRGVRTVILTLGARGAFVADASRSQLVHGFPVKAVDTTAAGDVFNGALAVALGEGRPVIEAVRFANAAAAISVTRLGAQPSAPARKQIELLMTSAKTTKGVRRVTLFKRKHPLRPRKRLGGFGKTTLKSVEQTGNHNKSPKRSTLIVYKKPNEKS